MRRLSYLISFLMAIFIAACGGGGSPGLSSGAQPPTFSVTAPATLTLQVGLSQKFAIQGGVKPYYVISTDPAVAIGWIGGDDFVSVGAIVPGKATITVLDDKGTKFDMAVTSGSSTAFFTTTPTTLTIAPAASAAQTYALGGGTPPYTAVSNFPRIASVAVNGNNVTIIGNPVGEQDPVATASATVSFRDAAGATLSSAVTVATSKLTLSLTTAQAYLGDVVVATITGGTPPYRAQSGLDGIVTAVITNGNRLEMTLERLASPAVVSVFDANNQRADVSLTIIDGAPGIRVSPAALTVSENDAAPILLTTYGVSTAGAPTVFSSDPTLLQASYSNKVITVVTGTRRTRCVDAGGASATISIVDSAGHIGTSTITIKDNNGKEGCSTEATVVPGALFTTAPSAVTMAADAMSEYQVSGGYAPYMASSSNSAVATASVSSSGKLTITGVASGKATITIFDSKGTKLTVDVTVEGTSGASGVSTIDIFASSNTLGSAPGSRLTFTVNVKDLSNNAVPKQSVVFSSNGGTLFGATPAPVTDANGTISTVSLSPGADASNRTIRVTATVGAGATAKSKFFDIPVVGTTLSISGVNSALAGSPASSFTLKALDSGGKAISGAQLSVAVSNTSGSSALSVPLTDSTGTSIVTFTPLVAGKNTLTVSGLGASVATDVMVSNEDFAFTAPVAATNMTVSTPYAVTACYKVATVGQGGLTVAFSTTRGTLSAPSALTVSTPGVAATDGCASVTVTSTTAGPVTISGQLTLPGSTPRSGITAAFVAVTPSVMTLQANPASVAPNAAGATTNYSDLTATVRDATGNPVAGIVVNFAAVADLSNGSISPGTGTTDSNGIASAKFIPGGLSTATNGVTLRASLPAYPAVAPANAQLTVSGQALFISIGRASDLGILDNVTYKKDFSVYVTDASGAPAANRAVALSVIPKDGSGVGGAYAKGNLKNISLVGWAYNTVQWCPNEDANSNGILDAGEDTNTDGRLTPGLPVVVTPGAVTTDANGYASFSLRYGKNFAWWVNAEITARASVGGTESKQLSYYMLELDADTATAVATPPNQTSPFGTVASCISPN